jgi:biotin synthase
MAGANSIFAGDKLLTTPNPEYNSDMDMFRMLGLTPKAAFADGTPQDRRKAVQHDAN